MRMRAKESYAKMMNYDYRISIYMKNIGKLGETQQIIKSQILIFYLMRHLIRSQFTKTNRVHFLVALKLPFCSQYFNFIKKDNKKLANIIV